jgi:hypothetical protein
MSMNIKEPISVLIYIVYTIFNTFGPLNMNLDRQVSTSLNEPLSGNLTLIFGISILVIFMINSILGYLIHAHLNKSVHKYLMGKKDLDKHVIEHIVEELNYIDQFQRLDSVLKVL